MRGSSANQSVNHSLKINDEIVPEVEHVKYLGTILNRDEMDIMRACGYTPSGTFNVSLKGLENARILSKFYYSKPTCIKCIVQVIGQNIAQPLSKT